jgi:hypothetical protein
MRTCTADGASASEAITSRPAANVDVDAAATVRTSGCACSVASAVSLDWFLVRTSMTSRVCIPRSVVARRTDPRTSTPHVTMSSADTVICATTSP